MTYYLRQGSAYQVTPEANLDVHKKLPVGNYVIRKDQRTEQLYFEAVDSFSEMKKIYGNHQPTVDRILNTFDRRSNSTGVLLSGEKGSGKTLVAKLCSIKGAELGYPSIIIDEPWHGSDFNRLIQNVSQPAIVVFDEFEKVYDREEQESLLTLLDGAFPTKKLFILTCNDKYRVDEHMTNRPGRVFYSIEYTGLEDEFIREYCDENLNDKQWIDAICRIASLFYQFNFDILQGLVEEMNRYNESPTEAIKFVNAKPDADNNGTYDISLYVNDKLIPKDDIWPKSTKENPLKSRSFTIEQEVDGDEDDIDHRFSLDNLTKIDPKEGEFTFEKDTTRVIFRRQKTQKFDLSLGYDRYLL